MIAFGPVSSRRLGRSLGINNIPNQKLCTYSCIYCQLGETGHYSRFPDSFYEPSVIYSEVSKRLKNLHESIRPDYLTFVSSGEPTLDLNLGRSIERVRDFGIPIAVITNGSLLSDERVREMLCKADLVSLKCDSANDEIWKTVNRPMPELTFNKFKQGLLAFSHEYRGHLLSETMLLAGINDSYDMVLQTASFIAELNPEKAFLSIPTRPPALPAVSAPDENVVNRAWQVFTGCGLEAELLCGFEGVETGTTEDVFEDVINMCSVHPIREDTMKEILRKDRTDENIIDGMINAEKIVRLKYGDHFFLIRRFKT